MFGRYKRTKRTRGNIKSLFREETKVRRCKLYRELYEDQTNEGISDKIPGAGTADPHLTKPERQLSKEEIEDIVNAVIENKEIQEELLNRYDEIFGKESGE